MTTKQELNEQQKHWFGVLQQAKSEIGRANDQIERAREMMLADFHADIGTIDGRPVFELKRTSSKRFNRKQFEADNPGMTEDYITESESESLHLIGDK